MTIQDIQEQSRLELQKSLDAAKSHDERNKLGQFATPTALAADILSYARLLMPDTALVRFLDPAFGTGAFYSALLSIFAENQVKQAEGYEIDPHYGNDAAAFWIHTPLKLYLDDFTNAVAPKLDAERANLLICNPPYVRHHHIEFSEKLLLLDRAQAVTGLRLNGLAGLYAYFLFLSHAWMADNGLAGWLIPSEFMDVNYGKQIKEYLLSKVTLLRIHRFDPKDVQFNDALVSSAVVWFRKTPPPVQHQVEFSYGGTLADPAVSRNIPASILQRTAKWTRYPELPDLVDSGGSSPKLSDLFTIKRGVATGGNDFFILTPEIIEQYQIPGEFLTPILPSPRYMKTDEVEADQQGNPVLDRKLFLLTCSMNESFIQAEYPGLWEYLQSGIRKGVSQGYLCQHRSPWYSQENRPAAPIICTYMGRQRGDGRYPFRFILNHSRATVANVYLMLYPKPLVAAVLEKNPHCIKDIWQALTKISPETLLGEGRVYGGGLHKLEPKELGNAPADRILEVVPDLAIPRIQAAEGMEVARFEQISLFAV
jgi:adenine-specific DNA-methyltransferase